METEFEITTVDLRFTTVDLRFTTVDLRLLIWAMPAGNTGARKPILKILKSCKF
jgi:hypothetical protein